MLDPVQDTERISIIPETKTENKFYLLLIYNYYHPVTSLFLYSSQSIQTFFAVNQQLIDSPTDVILGQQQKLCSFNFSTRPTKQSSTFASSIIIKPIFLLSKFIIVIIIIIIIILVLPIFFLIF